MTNITFELNNGIGRGSIIMSEQHQSNIKITNCVFRDNFGYLGLIMSQHDSMIIIKESLFDNNFALIGGVLYV